MRQETINIYTINEHPDKDACFQWIRENWHDLGDHVIEDAIESLKALAQAVNGTLGYCICINPDQSEYVTIKNYDKTALKALYKVRDECPLTGVCYDHDAIESLFKGDDTLLNTLHAEGEFIYSDEGLQELCEANEYEFLTCGEAA
jgi:hypothetical protein